VPSLVFPGKEREKLVFSARRIGPTVPRSLER